MFCFQEAPVNSTSSEPESTAAREKESVAAVVVTFNRKALLAECLHALLAQTRPVDAIYVIDQASTDGTQVMMEESGFLQKPQILYHYSATNTGGAGGFHRGMQLAHAAGYDWVWLMDDDAIATPEALSHLLQYRAVPRVIAVANKKIRLDGSVDISHFRVCEELKYEISQLKILSFSSFVGLMVNRKVIEMIGLPKAEFFYMYDDNEYCRRLCLVGRIVLAEDSVIVHKEAGKPSQSVRRFGRNLPVISRDVFCFRHYFLWRNRVWMECHTGQHRLRNILNLIVPFLKATASIALVNWHDFPFKMCVLARAVLDGVLGRLDNEFPFRMREKTLRLARERN